MVIEWCVRRLWCVQSCVWQRLGVQSWAEVVADWYLVWGEWDWVGWLGVGLLVCGGGWVFG